MKLRKLTSVLLTASMIASLAACSKTETVTEDTTETEATSVETTEAETSTTVSEETEQTTEEETKPTAFTSAYEGMTAEEIVATLTLEQKVAQMFQPAFYN